MVYEVLTSRRLSYWRQSDNSRAQPSRATALIWAHSGSPGNAQLVGRAASDARQQRRAAGIQAHQYVGRGICRGQRFDSRRQQIGDAAALGTGQRQADVAGMHAKAQALAERFRPLRHQHLAARKVRRVRW